MLKSIKGGYFRELHSLSVKISSFFSSPNTPFLKGTGDSTGACFGIL